jgi:single-strand DNA-binding protein
MRYTPSGKSVTEFSIAVNEGSGEKRTTEFIDCLAWERLAENIAEYCRKGKKVLVVGRYNTDRWMDKQTNKERRRVRIVCTDVEFLDQPGSRERSAPEPQAEELEDIKF